MRSSIELTIDINVNISLQSKLLLQIFKQCKGESVSTFRSVVELKLSSDRV